MASIIFPFGKEKISYHMIPARSLDDAMKKAEEILGNKNAKITAIPDGVAVMVTK